MKKLIKYLKKNIEKLMNYFKKNIKSLVAFIITISFSLIFLDSISSLLIKIGSNINIDSYSFIVGYLLISVLIISLYFYLIFNYYIHNKRVTFLILATTSTYIIYRFIFTNLIDFLQLDGFPPFADIILLIALLHSFNLILKKKKEEKKSDFFLEDTLFSNDIIDNELILNKLIEVTSNLKPDIAFNIGINAVWGYGKSTFLDRFEKVFKKKNKSAIVFWYRVWKNKTSAGIIENFFEELKLQLSPHSGEISNSIDNYVKAVLDLSPSEIQKLITTSFDLFNDTKSLERYFNEINEAIQKIDKRIIILLDDLDRLDKQEILNSLKLIRTISDFNNVIFIAGYDRKYIVDSINQPGGSYLDKIFNVELNLLPFKEDKLIDQLFETIDIEYPGDNSFNEGFKNLFEEKDTFDQIEFNPVSNEENDTFDYNINLTYLNFLPTYRDIKRFINEFKFYTSFFESTEDVYSYDYILQKLLVYKYRELNNDLFNNLDDILSIKILSIQENKVSNNPLSNGGDIYVLDNKAKEKVESILGTKYSNLDKQIILSSLSILFSKKGFKFYEENQNCIAKLSYVNFYLRNNIVEGGIKISEFKEAFNNNELFKLLKKFNEYKPQLILSLKKELITFIRKSAISTKEQVKDALKTINIIAGANNYIFNYYDSLTFFNKIYENIYKNELIEFQDLIENIIIDNNDIGFLDKLLSESNIRKERSIFKIKSGTNTGNEEFEFAFLEKSVIKKILLKKLENQIKKEASVEHIVSIYHLFTERLVPENRIIRSIESNKLIRIDIEKRVSEYINSKLFEFNRSSLDIEFSTFQPNFLLASIFVNEKTYKEFLDKDTSQNKYDQLHKEGWHNLNKFIQGLNFEKAGIDKKEFGIVKKVMQAFIDNNCIALSKIKYENIINEHKE